MAAVVNFIDTTLQSAASRTVNLPTAQVLLKCDTNGFHVNTLGVGDPVSITFTAALIDIEGSIVFACTGGTLTSVTANSATLTYANMSASTAAVTATVTVNGQAYSDSKFISKILDGAAGPAGSTTFIVYAYQRSASAPTLSPGAVTVDLSAKAITTASLANGWLKTMPAPNGNPLYITAATASGTGATDDIASNEWTGASILSQDGAAASLLTLSASAQAITFNGVGAANPSSQTITLTANLQNLTGTATFACTGYNAAGASLGAITLGGSGNTRTLTNTLFGSAAYAIITASLSGLSDTMTVIRLADGAGGVSALGGYLTNEAVTVPTASDGSGAILTGAVGNFKVYQGTTDVTAGCTFAVFGSPVVTTSINTAGAYSVTAIGTWSNASLTTNVIYRATHTASGATFDGILTITKAPAGLAGAAGLNSATVTIYQRAATSTPPALPSATTTLTFASGVLTGLNNGWAQTIPAASAGAFLHASTATAISSTATDDIAAGEWAAAKVITQTPLLGSPDSLILDPQFKDLAWWGRIGNSVAAWAESGAATGWIAGASMYLSQNPAESISYSQPFPITPGATYLVQVQVSLSSDFNGRFSTYWTISGDRDYNMVDRSTGTTWSDGLPVQLNSTSPKGLVTFTTTYTVPLSGTLSKGVIQIRNSHTVGTVEVGSFSITRVADSSLIAPGVTLENPTINTPLLAAQTLGGMTAVNTTGPNGITRSITRTASPSGGRSPYRFLWVETTAGGMIQLSNTTSATVTIKANGTSETQTGTVACTATDANGIAISGSFDVSMAFT